jgi:hypothetical protein
VAVDDGGTSSASCSPANRAACRRVHGTTADAPPPCAAHRSPHRGIDREATFDSLQQQSFFSLLFYGVDVVVDVVLACRPAQGTGEVGRDRGPNPRAGLAGAVDRCGFLLVALSAPLSRADAQSN